MAERIDLRNFGKKILSVLLVVTLILGTMTTVFARNDNRENGSKTSVDHIDINVNVTASVILDDGTVKDVDFTLTKNDAKYVTITATQGGNNFTGFNADGGVSTSSDGRTLQIRLEGDFPVGTRANPVIYTVVLEKPIVVAGAEEPINVKVSSTMHYWSPENECPGLGRNWQNSDLASSASGIDLTFGKAAGTSSGSNNTEEDPTGTITLQKVISGASFDKNVTYTVNVLDSNNTVVATKELTVKAGETESTNEMVPGLELGAYTIVEVTNSLGTITVGEDEYEFKGVSYKHSEATEDSDVEQMVEGNTVTLTKDNIADVVSITNTYELVEKEVIIPTATLTVKKVVSGAVLAEDASYTLNIVNSKNEIVKTITAVVKAGTTESEVYTITDLALDTYTVVEAATGNIVNGEDEYEFKGYTAGTVEFTENKLADTIVVTNTYELVEKEVIIPTATLTVKKVVSGAVLAEDASYTLNIVNSKNEIVKTITAVVKAGATESEVYTITDLALDTYTVVEAATGNIVNGEDEYEFKGYTAGTVEFTENKLADTIVVTNTYELVEKEEIKEEIPPVTATLTIKKSVNGIALDKNTTFTFNVINSNGQIVATKTIEVKAGTTFGPSIIIEDLPLDTYTVEEVTTGIRTLTVEGEEDAYTLVKVEYRYLIELDWLFGATMYVDGNTVTLSEDNLDETVVVTNTYKKNYVENPIIPEFPDNDEVVDIPDPEVPQIDIPEEPEIPEIPEVPEEPEIPEVPEEPEIPETPVDPVDPEIDIPEEDVPLTDIPDEPVPQTGDSLVWYALSAISGIGLIALNVVGKKRKENA